MLIDTKQEIKIICRACVFKWYIVVHYINSYVNKINRAFYWTTSHLNKMIEKDIEINKLMYNKYSIYIPN